MTAISLEGLFSHMMNSKSTTCAERTNSATGKELSSTLFRLTSSAPRDGLAKLITSSVSIKSDMNSSISLKVTDNRKVGKESAIQILSAPRSRLLSRASKLKDKSKTNRYKKNIRPINLGGIRRNHIKSGILINTSTEVSVGDNGPAKDTY